MENFNKVLSFVLGLVVVVIILAVISARLRESGSSILSFGKQESTPTPKTQERKQTPEPTNKSSERGGLFGFLTGDKKEFPTPTQKPKKGGQDDIITPTPSVNTQGLQNTKGGLRPTTIPKTGAPTAALILSTSALAAGIYLRKISH